MLSCINKNSAEFRGLVAKSGLSESFVEAISRSYMSKYGRFPYLDELPQSNSEPELKRRLKVSANDSVKLSNLAKTYGTDNINTIQSEVNDEFRDLEVKITPIVEDALVDITHRPTTTNYDVHPVELDDEVNSLVVFTGLVNKLSELYGINIIPVTNEELSSEEWSLIPDGSFVNAFVYNGNIYLNTDNSSVDSPIHEMMHLLIGSLRFKNPNLYTLLISMAEQLDNYQNMALQYKGRTRNDINEEIFVTELGKYLAGIPSAISNIPEDIKHEIHYNVLRMLDTLLMGQDSVKVVPNVYNMSLKELATLVQSMTMKNNFSGTFNVENSSYHRQLNNIKKELISKLQLREECD